ncbi:MAG: DUF2569 family protein [Nanoarchaeota archaeon]|nr:DUF2569 family protein [Nanoarchaeota archaeon]
MAKCSLCGRKISFWNEYEKEGNDYCEKCFNTKKSDISKLEKRRRKQGYEEITKTRDIMTPWAKVVSIFSALVIFYNFYIKFDINYLWFGILLLLYGFFIIIPLFYYGYKSNTQSKTMRIWTKVASIISILAMGVYLISPQLFLTLPGLLSLAEAIPLFYFGWLASNHSKKQMTKKREPRGIGGWLLLFVIVQLFGILNSLSAIGMIKNAFYIVSQLTTMILAIVGLVLIFKKLKSAIKWNIAFLWISLACGAISSVFGYSYIQNILSAAGYPADFPVSTILTYGIIISVIWIIIWTLYFIKSKRIKNTLVK